MGYGFIEWTGFIWLRMGPVWAYSNTVNRIRNSGTYLSDDGLTTFQKESAVWNVSKTVTTNITCNSFLCLQSLDPLTLQIQRSSSRHNAQIRSPRYRKLYMPIAFAFHTAWLRTYNYVSVKTEKDSRGNESASKQVNFVCIRVRCILIPALLYVFKIPNWWQFYRKTLVLSASLQSSERAAFWKRIVSFTTR